MILRRTPLRDCRTGFTIIECLSAVALLTVFSMLVIPVIGKVQEMQHEQAMQQLAMTTLRDLAEEDLLHQTSISALSADMSRQFNSPDLQIKREPVEDDLQSTHVTLSLRWKSLTGRFVRPVQLSYWKFVSE